MTIGSIVSLGLNEKDQTKINFAIGQLLQRNGGQQVNSVVSTTSDYTAKVSDFLILASGNSNVTLPSASSAPGQIYCVKKTDSSATTITVDNNANTIDGSTSASLTSSYQVLMVQSDATQYDSIIKTTAFDFSAVLQTSNALSELTTNAAAARSNIGLSGLSTSATYLQKSNALSELTTAATTARSNIGAAGKTQTQAAAWNYSLHPMNNSTFDVVLSSPYAATITQLSVSSQSATCSAQFTINGTNIGGGSLSASSAVTSTVPTSANSMSSGDVLRVVLSSVSGGGYFFATIGHSVSVALS